MCTVYDCRVLWDLSGWLFGNYALILIIPSFQCHLPYLASCCGCKGWRAILVFPCDFLCHILFLTHIFYSHLKFSPSLFFFFPYSYLCFSVAPLTFSHVTTGTNLAVSFLERPNSLTQQRESVWVHEGEKERSCHADTITNIQTHNKEKAKKGKQAEACHAGDNRHRKTATQKYYIYLKRCLRSTTKNRLKSVWVIKWWV